MSASDAFLRKKIKKSIQKLVVNSTQVGEYLTGQATWNGNDIREDNDLDFFLETDPINNSSSRLPELRSGDGNLAATIKENFFYQHIFNFALVTILLLQVCVVWAFIWCRLAKYSDSQSLPLDQSSRHRVLEIDLRERDPRQDDDSDNDEPQQLNLDLVAGMMGTPPTPRSGRFG